ncbi:MAG: copper resistance protein [Sphaerisporangium sp.]|nr:copper resistance protein [Sphaerisporangium sp.]
MSKRPLNNLINPWGQGRTGVARPRGGATVGAWRAATMALAILAGVIALQVAAAGPAAAHTRLVSSSPGKGAKMDRLPQVVKLKFSEVVRQPAALVVTGPDGTEISTGKAAVVDATLSRHLANSTGPAAGRYTMSYRVTSGDGHPLSGTVTFTLSNGNVASAAPTVDDGIPATSDRRLVSSSPGTGAQLNRLPEVAVLNFKELVRQPATLVVTGPDGAEISTGEASVVDATLLRPLDSTTELAAGRYTMRYRVTSAVGQPISGTVPFTLPDGQVAAEADLLVGDDLGSKAVAAPATDSPAGAGIVVALVIGLAAALGVAVVSVGRLVGREPAA